MRILLVEDDTDVSKTLRANLETERFAVDTAEDAEQGSYLARTNDYDLILLDYVLPKGDGRTVCVEIRRAGKSTPIIMLTVKDELDAKVDAFRGGVDDYVMKPYSFQELLARIRAVLRRSPSLEPDILEYRDLRLDVRGGAVLQGENEVRLTRKEFMLLEQFMRQKGTILSRATLNEHVWDGELDSFSNTIETHILSLRKKIDTPGHPSLIQTVPGRGYRLGSPVF